MQLMIDIENKMIIVKWLFQKPIYQI